MHTLTSELDGGESSASRPGRFTPRERVPGNHWIRGWVGLLGCLCRGNIYEFNTPSDASYWTHLVPLLHSLSNNVLPSTFLKNLIS